MTKFDVKTKTPSKSPKLLKNHNRKNILIMDNYLQHTEFSIQVELVDWVKETAMKANTYLIINPYLKSRTADRRPCVTLAYERRCT
ncbi:hypothetical protein M9H77_18806 [Catharanthus roseus]|uniref:Uncharacterized protein n=1 Tax=Catharanthus roseus TaxID=4058 RepID=A0ACC0B8N5_CATRO|nr:hypothetical protein M9H77_18806 [Catharanthus roseus]